MDDRIRIYFCLTYTSNTESCPGIVFCQYMQVLILEYTVGKQLEITSQRYILPYICKNGPRGVSHATEFVVFKPLSEKKIENGYQLANAKCSIESLSNLSISSSTDDKQWTSQCLHDLKQARISSLYKSY